MKNCDRVPTSVVMFVAIVASVLFVTSTASGLPLLPQQASAFNKLHHWIKWHEQGAIASIGQENDQNAVCISGSSTIGSCNQSASNFNSGNAVAANVGGGSGLALDITMVHKVQPHQSAKRMIKMLSAFPVAQQLDHVINLPRTLTVVML